MYILYNTVCIQHLYQRFYQASKMMLHIWLYTYLNIRYSTSNIAIFSISIYNTYSKVARVVMYLKGNMVPLVQFDAQGRCNPHFTPANDYYLLTDLHTTV